MANNNPSRVRSKSKLIENITKYDKEGIFINPGRLRKLIEFKYEPDINNPEFMKVFLEKAINYKNRREFERAYIYFLHHILVNGEEVIAYDELVECSTYLNNVDEVLDMFLDYSILDIQNVNARYCLAKTFYVLGNLSEAKVHLEIALEMAPEHTQANNLLQKIIKI